MSLVNGVVRNIIRGVTSDLQRTQIPIPLLDIPFDGNDDLRHGVGSVTTTRSTTGTFKDKDDGLIKTAAIDVARFETNGRLIEGASENEALHSRDFTNAVHVKTGVTALKDATGADGVTNSASTLTATAPNGTAFQTVTKASAENTFSIDIRRKTGTGTVEITDDGGSTFTDITSLINAVTYTRFQITTTQANPSFGPRIVTSGDEIEVDYEGLEALPFASSRIPTVASTVPRATDNLSISTTGNFNETEGTVSFEYAVLSVDGADQVILEVSDGTAADRHQIFLETSTDKVSIFAAVASVPQLFEPFSTSLTPNTPTNIAYSYKLNDFAGYQNGGLEATDTLGTVPIGLTIIHIGNTFTGSAPVYGHIKNFKTFPQVLTPNQVKQL